MDFSAEMRRLQITLDRLRTRFPDDPDVKAAVERAQDLYTAIDDSTEAGTQEE